MVWLGIRKRWIMRNCMRRICTYIVCMHTESVWLI